MAQFHQYADLPGELRIKVTREFIVGLRNHLHSIPRSARLPFEKFAPFALVHSEWQHEFEAEQELFGSLSLCTNDLPAFHMMLNQRRRDFLLKVSLQVYINNTVVEYNGHTDHLRGNNAVVSQVCDFIVSSVATILESVEHAICTGSQATKKRLEFQTQIMMPSDMDYSHLRRFLSLANGLDCDFSQLPLIHCTGKFSQRRFEFGQGIAVGHPMVLLLSPSSLLTLVSRMPNLEQADVSISSRASFGVVNTQNVCPQLKTLKISPFSTQIPWYTLSRLATCWGDKIENLEAITTHAPSSLRVLVKREGHTQAIAWPNLQVLRLRSFCDETRLQSTVNVWTTSEGPVDTLCAMADAVPWLPSIRDMTIKLVVRRGRAHGDSFKVVIRMQLCSGSSSLTIPRPSRYWERRQLGHVPDSDSSEPSGFSFEHQMQVAATDIQAAVRTYRGYDLQIVWRETLEEPQLR